MRLFFSVDLPDDLAPAFERVQSAFADAAGLTLTHPEQAHVTLKFLGNADPDRLDDLESAAVDAVAAADVDPFDCAVGGLGTFPSLEYISVVWVGVGEGGAELTGLHEALEAAATDLGFDPVDHDFTPHLTLARMNDARGKDLVQRLVRERDADVGRFRVEEVRLKKSELAAEGPAYETVGRFPLDDPGAGGLDL